MPGFQMGRIYREKLELYDTLEDGSYLTTMAGIAFWLRIARIISKIPYLSGKMVYIGRNTYSIMMHHMAAFMLVKGVFYLLSCLTPLCADFDSEMF